MDTKTVVNAFLLKNWFNFTERLAQGLINVLRQPYKGVTFEKNVAYGKGSPKEIADLIYPAEQDDKKLPVMIYIHGGGWISGIKDMRRTYCYEYASRGYFVVNIDYDLAPAVQFKGSVQQCLKAVDYVYDIAEKYNLDTNRVVLAGESAGAYYVAMLAAIAKNKEILRGLGLYLKHTEFDVIANLFNCGAFDIKSCAGSKFPGMKTMVESFTGLKCTDILAGKHDDEVALMSPVTYVDDKFPPTFMLYASRDALQIDSFAFKKRLDQLGVPNGIYKCDGPLYGNHAFAVAPVVEDGRVILKATMDFINKYVFTDDAAAVAQDNPADSIAAS